MLKRRSSAAPTQEQETRAPRRRRARGGGAGRRRGREARASSGAGRTAPRCHCWSRPPRSPLPSRPQPLSRRAAMLQALGVRGLVCLAQPAAGRPNRNTPRRPSLRTNAGAAGRRNARQGSVRAQGDEGGVRCAQGYPFRDTPCRFRGLLRSPPARRWRAVTRIRHDVARSPACDQLCFNMPSQEALKHSVTWAPESLPRAPTAPSRDREAGQGSNSDDDDDKFEGPIKHAHPLGNLDYHSIGEPLLTSLNSALRIMETVSGLDARLRLPGGS